MHVIVPIVEGHGEVSALPVLVRRVAAHIDPAAVVDIKRPIRVPRGKLLVQAELAKAVELAARMGGDGSTILILFDADGECPVSLAETVANHARGARADRSIRIVVADWEYESWFLAGIASLAGNRGLKQGLTRPASHATISDPKGWISRHSTPIQPYRETVDQAALSALLDVDSARVSRSFDKLFREVENTIGGSD